MESSLLWASWFPRPLEQNRKQYIYVLREKSIIAQWLLFHSSEDIMEFSIMFQLRFLYSSKIK